MPLPFATNASAVRRSQSLELLTFIVVAFRIRTMLNQRLPRCACSEIRLAERAVVVIRSMFGSQSFIDGSLFR